MFFLNLGMGEFIALLGALSGIIVTLYLLDRAKKKRIVSTLRFWASATHAEVEQNRRKVREPWSLILQLLSLLLLLLAIAQLQWGARKRRGSDNVVLLDTSAWMASRVKQGTLMDEAKRLAQKYVASLASTDRVMLVRVDALTTPITSFTSNKDQITQSIKQSSAGYSSLNLEQAFAFAERAQRGSDGEGGEVVYIGARRIAEPMDSQVALPPGVRVIPVGPIAENCGIRRIGARQSPTEPNTWLASVSVKNYGSQARQLQLQVTYGGIEFAPKLVPLAPGEEKSIPFSWSTTAAGWLNVKLTPGDSLPADDHALLELPKASALRVAVYTSRPDVLRPLLAANHNLQPTFLRPDQFQEKPNADVAILDQFAPSRSPVVPSLWIDPPRENSPLPVFDQENNVELKNWHTNNPIGAGLHSKGTRVHKASLFRNAGDDIIVASVDRGPIIIGRPAHQQQPKLAAIGFDPLDGAMRFELTTPILFANILRWLSPDAFRNLELNSGTVGNISTPVDASEQPEKIRVRDDKDNAVPFTVRDQTLQFYVSNPSIVRLTSENRERIFSLTLPELAGNEWKPPQQASEGLPLASRFVPSARDLWKWLAIAGLLGLLLEWLLFGDRRIVRYQPGTPAKSKENARKRELVAK